MNSNKRFLAVLGSDRELLAIFSGIVLTGIALISLMITAGICYL